MIVKEAREVRRHGKPELIADRREALRSVGDGRNRLFQPRDRSTSWGHAAR